MRVNTNYNSPSFGIATITPGARQLLRKVSTEEYRKIEQWQEDPKIKDSKNWDLRIDYFDSCDGIYPVYINKDEFAGETHAGGLDAFKVEGDTVHAYSYTGDDDVHEILRFSSPERAKEAFEVMQGTDSELSTFERVERYMKTLKFLDESYEFMKKE